MFSFVLGTLPWQLEFVFGSLCLFFILMLILFIAIAVWVYKDAESRGMSGGLWLIIVILLGIIGLIIYLVVRKDRVPQYGAPPGPYQQPPSQYYQPQPQQPPATAQRFCRSCGTNVPPGAVHCPNCGAPVQ